LCPCHGPYTERREREIGSMEGKKKNKKGKREQLTVLRVAVAHAEGSAAALVGRVCALILLVVAGAICCRGKVRLRRFVSKFGSC